MEEEAWKVKPTNLDELWESCMTAFFAVPDDFIGKLFESLLSGMDAVLQTHGVLHNIIFPKAPWLYHLMLL